MAIRIPKPVVIGIIKEIARKMQKFDADMKEAHVHLSNKNISEIIGKMAETTFAEILTEKLGYEVKYAKSDAEPDLFFTKTKEKFEIKMTSTDSGWQGGEFSTRPSEYFMISWGGNFDEFFVARAHISDKEWHSHIAKRRYGTSYSARDLYSKKDIIVYLGRFIKTKRGAIKVEREKIKV